MFGLKLTRITPPAHFPKYTCDKHGDSDIACVQYGTGMEASNVEEHVFCGRCFAEDVCRAFPVTKAGEKEPPKITLKGAA